MPDYSKLISLEKKYRQELNNLKSATDGLEALSIKMANEEVKYLKAKAICCLKQLADNQKVTVIKLIVDGETANERLAFKLADGVLKSANLNIKRLLKSVDACRTLISTEKALIKLV